MSSTSPRARHARVANDRALSQVYRDLRHRRSDRETFTELHAIACQRSTLLTNPVLNRRRNLAVEALRNLAEYAHAYQRAPCDWPGARGSMYAVVRSLAHHLLGRFPTPPFMSLVWNGGRTPDEQQRRDWVVAHAWGARWRGLKLPMKMTRKMEHLFLGSPDHLSLEAAMRRAELLALGADDWLVDAVLPTRAGEDLSNSAFWRTVMTFLARHQGDLRPEQVGPIIDFVHGVRFHRVSFPTATGTTTLEPPRPTFSIKGRTVASLMRQVEAWHKALGEAPVAGFSWPPSPWLPLQVKEPAKDPDDPPVIWEIEELTSSKQLRAEGRALGHCVATYATDCRKGRSRIWSLRRKVWARSLRPVITIEVDPQAGSIVQARGFHNRVARGKHLKLIQSWARREGLRLDSLTE